MRALYLRPSAAAVWSACLGYAALNDRLGTGSEPDDGDNEVREDGLACHWLAWQTWGPLEPGIPEPAVGMTAPNGRELTEEMFSAVDDYHAVLRSWPAPARLEVKIVVSAVLKAIQDGTPDAHAIHGKTLYLADLKFGFRPVEVWRNLQLSIYAWVLMALSGCTHAVLTIVQPRAVHPDGPVRHWHCTLDDLRPIVTWLGERALLALEGDPPCTVNPGCGDCKAAHACRTLAAAGGLAAETAYGAVPHELTPVELGYELTKLMAAAEHLSYRINGLQAQGEALNKRSVKIPGFSMQRTATRWRWREGAVPHLQRLGEVLGVEVMAEPKVLSPAKLRNSFPGVDVQSMYAERPAGELQLKPTDPLEAVRAFTKR
jgi:hypothetical protein